MMELVKFGKHWEIETYADYDRAMKALEKAEFCAMMSDDSWREWEECTEIARQRKAVDALAREKGII